MNQVENGCRGVARGLVMGDVVNLNNYRKLRERARAEKRGAEKRAGPGTTKAARKAARIEADRRSRTLDGKRLESEPGD